jgi:hypothetical protein
VRDPARACGESARPTSPPATANVPVSLRPRSTLRTSAAVSPTVVHNILMTENSPLASGTLTAGAGIDKLIALFMTFS